MSTATFRSHAPAVRALVASAALTLVTCVAAAHEAAPRRQSYQNDVLVSNGGVPAANTDPNLVNGWGVAFNPTGVVWVSDAGSGKSTLYDGNGVPQALVVTIPGPGGATGHPTGIVFSGGTDFVVTNGTTSGPARFIFATLNGTIAGWAPNVNAVNAFTAVDNSSSGAVYTGLALSGNGNTHLLYAANFRAGRVDVFDGTFRAAEISGSFSDPRLPAGYAPFGIQAIGGDVYVTYAKQGDDGKNAAGPGLGIVNVFDPDGNLLRRVASHGVLNAPWGLALAPASFGKFGGALLVGNFGDGTINAFDPRTRAFLGKLRDPDNQPLRIDGLWGIAFGNGVLSQETNSLHYAAGPNDEQDGAYGVISVVIN